MSIESPTYSESWHRVEDLRPRLRSAVRVSRHHFRGQRWYVLRDVAGNEHYRLHEGAYRFLSLLDGRRTVGRVWDICNTRLGDDAPTQPEVIQLLAQLWNANLLRSEVTPDVESLLKRQRRRQRREITGQLTSLLFPKFPLVNPDRVFDRMIPVMGWLFGRVGVCLWAVLIVAAGWSLIGRGSELWSGAKGLIDAAHPEKLLVLYAVLAGLKLLHEAGHGVACKVMARAEGTTAPVPVLGVMLLVLAPLPYVDASSSWGLRSKWRRMLVSAAGMYVELIAAAAAAIVWAHTAEDTLLHELCMQVVVVSGVSTILFNANPLLRYDGYYLLSDGLELPNLATRGGEMVKHLVKRHGFGVPRSQSPAESAGEAFWLVGYAIASYLYRILITLAIAFMVADQFFAAAAAIAIGMTAVGLLMPLGKGLTYLLTSPELERQRGRAIGLSAAVVGAIVLLVGMIPVREHVRAEGVLEPRRMEVVYMPEDGWLSGVAASGRWVEVEEEPGTALVTAESRSLLKELARLEAELEIARTRGRMSMNDDPAMSQAWAEQAAAIEESLTSYRRRVASLSIRPKTAGLWVGDELEQKEGGYAARGERVGMVVDPRSLMARVVVDQREGPRLMELAAARANAAAAPGAADGAGSRAGSGAGSGGGDAVVELRLKDRPEVLVRGRIERVLPAGQERLPSAALGYQAGGTVVMKPGDPDPGRGGASSQPQAPEPVEPLFEVWVTLDEVRVTGAGTLAPSARWSPRGVTGARHVATAGIFDGSQPRGARSTDADGTITDGQRQWCDQLFCGQRVVARFTVDRQPLAVQWYRWLRQSLQRRLGL